MLISGKFYESSNSESLSQCFENKRDCVAGMESFELSVEFALMLISENSIESSNSECLSRKALKTKERLYGGERGIRTPNRVLLRSF